MNKEKMVVAGVIGGGLIWFLAKKAGAVEDKLGAKVELFITDAYGNPVPHNSPYEFIEGESYTVTAVITNTSTRGAVPAPANLRYWMLGGCTKGQLFPYFDEVLAFSAGQSRNASKSFDVPIGWGGAFGELWIGVYPEFSDTELASAKESFNIVSTSIAYGATVSWA